MRLLGGWLAVIVVALIAVESASAAPIPSNIKITGRSCDRPLQVEYVSGAADRRGDAPSQPVPVHPWDDNWLFAEVSETPLPSGYRRVEMSWRLSPEVLLCPGGWTRLGWGDRPPITSRTGSVSGDVTAREPVALKLRARFAKRITLRDGLGPQRVRSLVGGWARRSCALRSSNKSAAKLLRSLAGRAGASGCRGPRQVRPTSTALLRHLSAYFNAARGIGGAKLGREYYRVLSQLTTF